MDKKALPRLRRLLPAVFVSLAAAVLFYVVYYHEPAVALKDYLESGVSPSFFIILMLVLPVFGVPLSVFLLLVGMRFGVASGIVISAVAMLLHMALTYLLVHSFLHDRVHRLLQNYRFGASLSQKVPNRWQGFILMLIPGPPYAVKNYLLAMTGMDFGSYLLVNWSAQFGLSIPFIIVGRAIIEMNLTVFALALALLLVCFLLQYYVGRKYWSSRKRAVDQSKTGSGPDADSSS